ncbi:MAG: hypothetical protein H7Y43_14015 [Akkermansiaceae bacterium]|nr:hypothetical protein [Verrucomicrobiales bacterium]
MTKKNISLIVFVLLLAGLSLYLNRDRFRSPTIQIGERWIQPRPGMLRHTGPKTPAKVLVFLLDRKVELTSVKVVPLADVQTNKYPHPIWELTTESNSIPLKDFIYGQPIRGMKPSVKGATADPLQPGVAYRLFVQAGSQKAEYDFSGRQTTP